MFNFDNIEENNELSNCGVSILFETYQKTIFKKLEDFFEKSINERNFISMNIDKRYIHINYQEFFNNNPDISNECISYVLEIILDNTIIFLKDDIKKYQITTSLYNGIIILNNCFTYNYYNKTLELTEFGNKLHKLAEYNILPIYSVILFDYDFPAIVSKAIIRDDTKEYLKKLEEILKLKNITLFGNTIKLNKIIEYNGI